MIRSENLGTGLSRREIGEYKLGGVQKEKFWVMGKKLRESDVGFYEGEKRDEEGRS